jgi:hypothetical protein
LDKYNEELNGEQKKSFKLGDQGKYDASDSKFIEKLNEQHRAKAIKLDFIEELKIAGDYMTPAEHDAIKFKKPKNKKQRRVLRKNKMLKADDLLPLPQPTATPTTITKNNIKKEPSTKSDKPISIKDIDFGFNHESDNQSDDSSAESASESEEMDEETRLKNEQIENELQSQLDEENRALNELHTVLMKTRQKMIKNQTDSKQDSNDSLIKQEPILHSNNGVTFDNLKTIVENDDQEEVDRSLTLDTMSEFCRNLGSLDNNKPTTSNKSHSNQDIKLNNIKKEQDNNSNVNRKKSNLISFHLLLNSVV